MAGQVATLGTPHLPFCKKAPCIYPISISFTKPPSYLYIPIYNLPFSSYFTSTRETPPKSPFPPPNPSTKKPQTLHLHLKTSRTHQGLQQGLHLQPPTPKATPRSTPSTQASTTWWIEAIFSSIGSSSKLNPSK